MLASLCLASGVSSLRISDCFWASASAAARCCSAPCCCRACAGRRKGVSRALEIAADGVFEERDRAVVVVGRQVTADEVGLGVYESAVTGKLDVFADDGLEDSARAGIVAAFEVLADQNAWPETDAIDGLRSGGARNVDR